MSPIVLVFIVAVSSVLALGSVAGLAVVFIRELSNNEHAQELVFFTLLIVLSASLFSLVMVVLLRCVY